MEDWSASRRSSFATGSVCGTHHTGGCVGPETVSMLWRREKSVAPSVDGILIPRSLPHSVVTVPITVDCRVRIELLGLPISSAFGTTIWQTIGRKIKSLFSITHSRIFYAGETRADSSSHNYTFLPKLYTSETNFRSWFSWKFKYRF
jgi:hypothetical protein